MRAVETDRADAMISDPFARVLAGEKGFEVLSRGDPTGVTSPPVVAVRTRFFDDAIRAALDSGVHQLVLLAAGMDSRAFRLEFPGGVRLYEIDQPEVLAYKEERLGNATPRCARPTVPVDLRTDWPASLLASGFDRSAPALWLVEGLLPYLHDTDVHALLSRISGLAAVRSEILFDVFGRALL